MPEPEPDPLTDDALLGGRIRLNQPEKGYRAGLDAALLAAALDLKPGERAVEAGCGVGGALIQAAWRFKTARFLGVERNGYAFSTCLQNVAVNAYGGRISVKHGDIDEGPAALGVADYDVAFANPPFFDDPSALRAPAPGKREAWMADGGLGAWTGFLLSAVREGGRVVIVHRADRLGDLMALLRSQGGGSLQVRAAHPAADRPAKRVLVQAVKGGRAPLRLVPPLILHDSTGAATPETQAILQGDAALPFETAAQPKRIKIRPYRPEDAEGLALLFTRSVREAAAPFYSKAERRAWAPDAIDLAAFAARRAAKPTWVAEIGGALAGFIDLEPDGHIDMLYVSADHQRRGVAAVLYRAVEMKARGQGVARLYTEASLAAQGFFARKGFTVIAEQQVERNGETLTNVRMEKRLEPGADQSA